VEYILIPARRGSKGLPLKNRLLVPELLQKLNDVGLSSRVILSTDDEWIQKRVARFEIKIRHRPHEIANDTAPMRAVLLDIIEHYKIEEDSNIMTLYPTYPERTYDDICKFIDFYYENNLNSALCKKNIKTHPYLCLIEKGICSETLIDHNLYRRQDYPKCFEISHFICASRASEVKKLNYQLFNDSTGFYSISDKIDIDHKVDLNKWKNEA